MINTAVYSWWSETTFSTGRFGDNGRRWTKPDLAVYWTLSTKLALEWFDEVIIYTDSIGKHFLEEVVQLKGVRIEYLTIPFNAPKWAWAYSKMLVYNSLDKPYMHLDYDLFWFKAPPADILEVDVAFQSIERGDLFDAQYRPALEEFYEYGNLSYLSQISHYDLTLPAYRGAANTGFLAVNDTAFIRRYSTEGIRFMHSLTPFVEKNPQWEYNILYEQYFLYLCLIKESIPFTDLLPCYVQDSQACEKLSSELGYTHLLGDSKFHPNTLALVHSKLASLYPNDYLRLRSLIDFSPSLTAYHP